MSCIVCHSDFCLRAPFGQQFIFPSLIKAPEAQTIFDPRSRKVFCLTSLQVKTHLSLECTVKFEKVKTCQTNERKIFNLGNLEVKSFKVKT